MGKQQTVQPQAVDTTPPELRGLRTDLANFAGGLNSQGPMGTAPMTAAQNSNLNTISNGVNVTSPIMNMGASSIGDILSGKFMNPSTNPGLQSMIDALGVNSQRNLGQSENMLDAQFARSGMMNGSPAVTASTALARGAQQDYTGQVGNLLNQNYQTGLQQMMSALGMVPNFDPSQISFNRALQAVSPLSQPQQVQQQQMTSQYQNPFNIMSALSGAINGGGQMQYMNPQFIPPQYLQIAQALGGLGQAGMGAAGMMMAL